MLNPGFSGMFSTKLQQHSQEGPTNTTDTTVQLARGFGCGPGMADIIS